MNDRADMVNGTPPVMGIPLPPETSGGAATATPAPVPEKSGPTAAGPRTLHRIPAPDRRNPLRLQLPSPPDLVLGRDAELAELAAVVRNNAAGGGIFLQGPAGVGKTTMLLRLAAALEADYPDARIYLDLRGYSGDPMSSAEALTAIARMFHPTIHLPDRFEELRELARSSLQGRRVLLLLDNVRDALQAGSLLPLLPRVQILATSRRLFGLPGFVSRAVRPLPAEPARDLLQALVPGLAPATADSVAAVCGGLPLALRVAGGTLAADASPAAADYLARLQDSNARLAHLSRYGEVTEERLVLEPLLDLAVALLPPELRGLWTVLSVFPGSFDLASVLAVAALDADSARAGLKELQRRGILERDLHLSRHQLHDVIREVAAVRLAETGREAAGERHARHYVAVLRQADDLYQAGDAALWCGLALVDNEWTNIVAGYRWAAGRAAAHDAAARICNDYLTASVYCLDLRLSVHDKITWIESALTAARRLKDRPLEGLRLSNLAYACSEMGDGRRAEELYEQAVTISREIGYRRAEGMDLGNLGNVLMDRGEPRRAVRLYEQALDIFRGEGDRRAEAGTLGNLGNAHAALNEPERAVEYYQGQLAIACETGDRVCKAIALWNMVDELEKIGWMKEAVQCAEDGLLLFEQLGDPCAERLRRRLERWKNAPVSPPAAASAAPSAPAAPALLAASA